MSALSGDKSQIPVQQPSSVPAMGSAAPAPSFNLCKAATNFFMGRATDAPKATKRLKGADGQATAAPAPKLPTVEEAARRRGINVPASARGSRRASVRAAQAPTIPALPPGQLYPTVPATSTARPELDGIRKRKGREESPEVEDKPVLVVTAEPPESSIWSRMPNLSMWGSEPNLYPKF
jgi:hypothetical protein